jgi:hypothetical protein
MLTIKFEVFMVVKIHVAIFLIITLCGLVDGFLQNNGIQLTELQDATTKKIKI